jgi:hypothetical protein
MTETLVPAILVGAFGAVLLLLGLAMIIFRRRMAYGFTGVYGKSVDSKTGRMVVAIVGVVVTLFGLFLLGGCALLAFA